MKVLYLLPLIGLIHANKEPCNAIPLTEGVNVTLYYVCDSNNDLYSEYRWHNGGTNFFVCTNEKWQLSTPSNISESCEAISVPEPLYIPIYYSCDSNNKLQANLTFATSLTHLFTTTQTCVNGVWVITDHPTSKAPPATTPTIPDVSQQDSSVAKVKPTVILMAISIILCFL